MANHDKDLDLIFRFNLLIVNNFFLIISNFYIIIISYQSDFLKCGLFDPSVRYSFAEM